MSIFQERLAQARSSADVAKPIHLHMEEVIYDEFLGTATQRVIICVAHRWASLQVSEFENFPSTIWPYAMTSPALIVPERGPRYSCLKDTETIESSPVWVHSLGTSVVTRLDSTVAPDAFTLTRTVESRLYAARWHLRHRHERLSVPKVHNRF